VEAKTQDEALAAAWQAYKPDAKWPLKVSNDLPDRDGFMALPLPTLADLSPAELRGEQIYYAELRWRS
jgi:hypothetical protein